MPAPDTRPRGVSAVKTRSFSQLSDPALLHELAAVVARDRNTTAEMLALIAEVDARKLYLPAAYPSMFAYCVGELRLSEDAAAKRIQVARAARRFPVILAGLAAGRLHLTGVGLLVPFLTEATTGELLEAATHRSKAEIEQLIADRFPRPDVPARIQALRTHPEPQHAPAHVGAHSLLDDLDAPVSTESTSCTPSDHAPAPVSPLPCLAAQHAPAHVEAPICTLPEQHRSSLKPLAPQTFAVRFTIRQSTHDKLRHAQAVLSHQVPAGDLAMLLDLLLDVAIPRLERRKFAATERPIKPVRRASRRTTKRSATATRQVPAHVRRAVWERDGGQCTFVSNSGRRCSARMRIEFDHILEVARGGDATVAGMRLRCRSHNQYGAERTFGAEFMRHKRAAAAGARARLGQTEVIR